MSVKNSLYSFDLVVRIFTLCYKINTLFSGYWKPHCFELAKNAYCFICFIQVFINIVGSTSRDLKITLILLGKDLVLNHVYVASLRADM